MGAQSHHSCFSWASPPKECGDAKKGVKVKVLQDTDDLLGRASFPEELLCVENHFLYYSFSSCCEVLELFPNGSHAGGELGGGGGELCFTICNRVTWFIQLYVKTS